MKVAIDISKMHKLNLNRGIGVYAMNLYSSLKKYTELDVDLIRYKSGYEGYDLVHYPYFDFFSRTLKKNLSLPTVVTIHDLIPIMFPRHYPPGLRGKINWHFQKSAIRNSKSIIAVSNTVKQDIGRELKIELDKISVVYSAPSENFVNITDRSTLKEIKEKYVLPDKFVLYVGNVNWNKNILNMTEAVIRSGKNLLIIGSAFLDKTNLDHPEKKSFKIWLETYENNEKIKILGYIEDADLTKIMNLATCLIFPSIYEGFGLPILEAQACGLPVVTSNTPAIVEISGNGALFIDPEDISKLAESVNNIFVSGNVQKELIKKGVSNLKRFSWKNTAIETLKVYKNAVS